MGADYKKALHSMLTFMPEGGIAANETSNWSLGVARNVGATVVQVVVPFDMVLWNLYVRQRLAPGAGEQVQYWLYNVTLAAVTALTCTIVNPALEAQDLVNVVALNAGDRICIQHTSSAAAAATNVTASLAYRRI